MHTAEHIEAVERGFELHSQDELGAFLAPSSTTPVPTGSWECSSNRSSLSAAGGASRVGQPGRV